ncbi:MAG: NUDIX domain-containing protein [Bacteroidota bacterium]|nr:NUDIX domain-containing protein [Bacteroidota bacterium]
MAVNKIPDRFTVRVYGILSDNDGRILLSTENINGFTFVKFPGGEIDFMEGAADALLREFQEETGLAIEIIDHLYTVDFFVQSHFNPSTQVIGIYYKVKNTGGQLTVSSAQPFMETKNHIRLFWKETALIQLEDFTFEMDRAAFLAWKHFILKH